MEDMHENNGKIEQRNENYNEEPMGILELENAVSEKDIL